MNRSLKQKSRADPMFNPNITIKNLVQGPQTNALVSLVARVLMAYIFLMSGWMKINAYSATAGYMESKGVPGELLPLSILIVAGGGLALFFGFQARLAALGLAIFTFICGFIFHGTGTPDDTINLMKNIAMTGGLLFLMLHGAGNFSVDYLIEKA